MFDRESWATLFVYTVAVGAMCLRQRLAFHGVLLCTGVCIAASLVGGSSFGTAISYAISTAGIGMLMLVMADLRTRNAELHEARTELARLAVAEERMRFARDLHDLLGHSLSLIALKAELAGRLLPHQGREAAVHVSEIEDVARGALTEVRDAVSGYRRMTLDDELEGARVALSAAGIEAEVLRPAVTLDPAVEAVLAWTVREGATNVIRHSHADRCSLKVTAGLGEAGVEVVDDGRGEDPGLAGVNGDSGHGIEGLRERVQRPTWPDRGRGASRGRFPARGQRPGRRPRVIRVLLAEDQAMVRGALASLLELEPDIEVVAQVSRGDEVTAAALQARPDVALLDIEMPGATGLEALEQLRRELPEVRILILTTFGRPGYLRRAMESGASGFLLKDAPAHQLASAIRRSVAGERVVDPGLAAAALSQGESPADRRASGRCSCASREHATVAEIAGALYLSPGTVRNHLSSVMQKLDARNRAEAVKIAEHNGWL